MYMYVLLVFTFFNILRRLPQLFAKDIALIQRLFQALCQVGSFITASNTT